MDSALVADYRLAPAPPKSSARLVGSPVAVPNPGSQAAHLERQEDLQEEAPPNQEVLAAVAPVVAPIRRVLLAVARRPAPRALALRKKHKTYWWGGFGNRTAGTRSSFLRLGRCRRFSQRSVDGSIPGLW